MSAKSPGVVSSAGTLFALPDGQAGRSVLRHSRALRLDMYLLIKAGGSRVARGRLFSAGTTGQFSSSLALGSAGTCQGCLTSKAQGEFQRGAGGDVTNALRGGDDHRKAKAYGYVTENKPTRPSPILASGQASVRSSAAGGLAGGRLAWAGGQTCGVGAVEPFCQWHMRQCFWAVTGPQKKAPVDRGSTQGPFLCHKSPLTVQAAICWTS